MYPQWDDPRRRNWLEQIDPSVLARVSQQPAGKRRTWLARGQFKAGREELKQSRRAEMLAPIMQRQQAMQMQTPLGDRERLALQQSHQEKMAERGFDVGREAATVAHGRRSMLAERGYEQAGTARDENLANAIALWRTKLAETPQEPPSVGGMRAQLAQGLINKGDVPGAERYLGVSPVEEPGMPSPTEQAGQWLTTGQPPEGAAPGWEDRYQQFRAMGTQPETEYEQLRAELAKWMQILRSYYKPGMMGSIGGETFVDEQTKNQALSMVQQISQQLQQITGQSAQGYEIGQILTSPQGQQGIIVGIDPNTGEPLIEPL